MNGACRGFTGGRIRNEETIKGWVERGRRKREKWEAPTIRGARGRTEPEDETEGKGERV